MASTLANQELVSETGKDVLRVITGYACTLNLLDRYDHGTLTIEETTRQAQHVVDYDEAIETMIENKRLQLSLGVLNNQRTQRRKYGINR